MQPLTVLLAAILAVLASAGPVRGACPSEASVPENTTEVLSDAAAVLPASAFAETFPSTSFGAERITRDRAGERRAGSSDAHTAASRRALRIRTRVRTAGSTRFTADCIPSRGGLAAWTTTTPPPVRHG